MSMRNVFVRGKTLNKPYFRLLRESLIGLNQLLPRFCKDIGARKTLSNRLSGGVGQHERENAGRFG